METGEIELFSRRIVLQYSIPEYYWGKRAIAGIFLIREKLQREPCFWPLEKSFRLSDSGEGRPEKLLVPLPGFWPAP